MTIETLQDMIKEMILSNKEEIYKYLNVEKRAIINRLPKTKDVSEIKSLNTMYVILSQLDQVLYNKDNDEDTLPGTQAVYLALNNLINNSTEIDIDNLNTLNEDLDFNIINDILIMISVQCPIIPIYGYDNEWVTRPNNSSIQLPISHTYEFMGETMELEVNSIEINERDNRLFRLNNSNDYVYRLGMLNGYDKITRRVYNLDISDSVRYVQLPLSNDYIFTPVEVSHIKNEETGEDMYCHMYNKSCKDELLVMTDNPDKPYILTSSVPLVFALSVLGKTIEEVMSDISYKDAIMYTYVPSL